MIKYLSVLMLGKAVSFEMSPRLPFPAHAPFPARGVCGGGELMSP